MTSQLPERPNLEQLKHQAKTLLRTAHAQQPDALARFRCLPAFAKRSDEALRTTALALHDAQSVIAREHGFPSWNTLREEVEARTLSFAAAVTEFLRCATDGASGRAQRLLLLHPGIADANLHTALVLGDVARAEKLLQANPELARTRGGPQDWEPLQYVCHTCAHQGTPERIEGLVALARRLLALGANPNAGYHWKWHPELPRTVLWGALCAVNSLPLARVLLESGAHPTDGVSLHLIASGGNIAAMELLREFGVDVNGIPGGLPPLRYILEFAHSAEGPRWLLEHGADPNLSWGEFDETAVHVAAHKWDVAFMELLAHHGADLNRRRGDGRTPYALAELHGNHAVAQWLFARGASEELSALDQFVSACARGDRAAAEAILRLRPALRHELQPVHHRLLHLPAERGETKIVATMLECGFDPNVRDQDGVTALHRAAMAGNAECVELLLRHGAAIDARDGMFDAPPLIWAVEGSTGAPRGSSDFLRTARLLLAAGPRVQWNPPETTPGRERVFEQLEQLKREAMQPDD